MRRVVAAIVCLVGTACAAQSAPPATTIGSTGPVPAPTVSAGDADAATAAFEDLIDEIEAGTFDTADITVATADADARHAWLLSDLLRFVTDELVIDTTVAEFDRLTGSDLTAREVSFRTAWNEMTNRLIAWDTPAPPDYQRLKGRLFTLIEPRWAPFFDDPDATVDWRWLSWGGVFIDDRPLGTVDPCPSPGCIPALDDPELVPAADGGWYDDDAIVFGVTEGDEAVAFPKNIMEVHEMVNITIGGRRFGIPYCTLCGSAQAYLTDDTAGEPLVLRTTGLLSRSNKVMFDLTTMSLFDTFTGEAVSGPLLDEGVVLDQRTVTVTTWGEWKTAHPDTRIVAEDGGIGRDYPDDPLGGRDDDGPIFPIGDVDARLPVQAPVIGVIVGERALAFERAALDTADGTDGAVVAELDGVRVIRSAGGYTAETDDGPIAAHEAFWFAWSQFHPETGLWTG